MIDLILVILIGVPMMGATLVRGWEAGDRTAKVVELATGDPVVALVARSSPPTVAEIDDMVGEALEACLGPGGLANLISPGDVVVINSTHYGLNVDISPAGRSVIPSLDLQV